MQTKICHLLTGHLFSYEFGSLMSFHIERYKLTDGGGLGAFGGLFGGRRKRDLAI